MVSFFWNALYYLDFIILAYFGWNEKNERDEVKNRDVYEKIEWLSHIIVSYLTNKTEMIRIEYKRIHFIFR